ncbi:D-alanyl-D-alanine carboxypeptidase family protein [Priestia koreensis]
MRVFSKTFIVIMCLLLSMHIFSPSAAASEKISGGVSARGAVLMEQSTGRVLYEKNPNAKMRIASITKIMTAIIAIESGKLDTEVKVSANAVKTEGSSVYLVPNEKIKLRDLVYGLMLRSGNDAAVAISESVGGSVPGFVHMMNQKAEEIGMVNTEFANPHGLDDHENHYSTAYDMALLMRYAMHNKTFRDISGTKIYRTTHPTEKWDRVWKNKNKLLTTFYKYCTGGKTGYTKRAKRTLVTTATKGNLNLIAVTINDPDDWKDHTYMFDQGFKLFKPVKIVEKGTLDDIKNSFYKNKLYVKRDFVYPLSDGEKDDVSLQTKLLKPQVKKWKSNPDSVPNIVGRIKIYQDDEAIGNIPIYLKKGAASAKKESPSFWGEVKHMFSLVIGVRSDG